jgi:hypothetical protein
MRQFYNLMLFEMNFCLPVAEYQKLKPQKTFFNTNLLEKIAARKREFLHHAF